MASSSSGGSRYFHFTAPKRYANTGDDVERGLKIGQEIGGIGQKLMGAINAGRESAKQNAVANQLLNQNFPGTAATTSPGGMDPDPDPMTAGGAPITDPNTPIPDQALPDVVTPGTPGNLQGGVDELKTRMAMRKLMGDDTDSSLNTQIKQAQLAGYLKRNAAPGKTGVQPQQGSLGGWENQQTGGGGQPGQQTGGQRRGNKPPDPDEGKTLNDPLSSPKALQDRIDGLHGSGTSSFLLSHMDTPPDLASSPGYAIFGADPNNPSAKTVKLPVDDFNTFQKQYNQLRVKQGLQPIGTGDAGKSPANPIDVASDLDAAAVPPKAYIRTPDGKIRQKP